MLELKGNAKCYVQWCGKGSAPTEAAFVYIDIWIGELSSIDGILCYEQNWIIPEAAYLCKYLSCQN